MREVEIVDPRGVWPFDSIFRFHVAGHTVICKTYPNRKRHTFRDFGIWTHDEELPPCPVCLGRLERRRYLVDISEFGGNGECACENFQFRFKPEARDRLQGWTPAKGPLPARIRQLILEHPLRCHHLETCRDYFLDAVLNEMTQQKQKHESDQRKTAMGLAHSARQRF